MTATPTVGPVYKATIQGNEFEADTCGGILTHIPGLDGYQSIPAGGEGDERAFTARLEHAYGLASQLQAVLAAAAANSGDWDMAAATEDHVTAIMGDRTIAMQIDGTWDETVPLVVVATHYAPYTDVPPPSGNVVALDPSDELNYLKSLAQAGLLAFGTVDAHEDDF